MDVGDIVRTHEGSFGVVVRPYRGVRGAWSVSVHLGGRNFSMLVYWDHQLEVIEEAA